MLRVKLLSWSVLFSYYKSAFLLVLVKVFKSIGNQKGGLLHVSVHLLLRIWVLNYQDFLNPHATG